MIKTKKEFLSMHIDDILVDAEISVSVQCKRCMWRLPSTIACVAFPDGIPKKIILGAFDHTKPYPKDNGIRFEKV